MRKAAAIGGAVAACLAASSAAAATDYYVSPNGDDANPGTAVSAPWRTIERVNRARFRPGDRVLFAGGETFDGGLRFTSEDAGTAAQPVVVGSYGDGRARIRAGREGGILVENAGGFRIENLIVEGDGYDSNTGHGIRFHRDDPTGPRLTHVRVDRVKVHGFGRIGIYVSAENGRIGYRDVRITQSEVHDNADAGISSSGPFDPEATGWTHQDLYVGHCRVYDHPGIPGKGSHSGNGIVLGDVEGAVIEHCIAYGNGRRNDHTGGGPVGIWAWDSTRVVIQFNESYSNRSSTLDGGGFDLDGGVTHSVIQYNYSHDNDGPGFLLAQFPRARPFHNNTVRYNVSQNDARNGRYGAIHFWTGGSPIHDIEVYHNTIYLAPSERGSPRMVMSVSPTTDVRIRNNLFVATGGVPMIDIEPEQHGLVLDGNSYWTGDDPFVVRWRDRTFDSLTVWRNETGHERSGLSVAPRLRRPGGGGTIGDTARLPELDAYRLRAGSPLIGRAIALTEIDPGDRDFFGTPIAPGTKRDIGAHQTAAAPR